MQLTHDTLQPRSVHLLNRNSNRIMCVSAVQNANSFLLSFQNTFSFFYKKQMCPIWNNAVGRGIWYQHMLSILTRSSLFPVLCPEHRLRPDSDERPGLPRRNVPPIQTPASHRAPVALAAHSSAHHPQGSGQGAAAGPHKYFLPPSRSTKLNKKLHGFIPVCPHGSMLTSAMWPLLC